MIRINLLPRDATDDFNSGLMQLGGFAAVLLIEAGILFVIYTMQAAELQTINDEKNRSKAEVTKLEKSVKDLSKLEDRSKQLDKQLEVLNALKKKRTGPVRVLDELQGMLSPPRNEEDRFAQRQNNWNVEWDTRRLWLLKFDEDAKKGNSFKIEGGAVSADDVAEFLQRMNTAEYFYDIELDVVQAQVKKEKQREVRFVTFKIDGKLTYQGKTAMAQEAKPPAGKKKGKKKKK